MTVTALTPYVTLFVLFSDASFVPCRFLQGTKDALRRVIKKLQAGEPITMTVIGGSLSALNPGEKSHAIAKESGHQGSWWVFGKRMATAVPKWMPRMLCIRSSALEAVRRR